MTTRNLPLNFLFAAAFGSFFFFGCLSVDARCYTLYEQALEDLDESRWPKAEEKLKRLVAENPNNADFQAELGRYYMDVDNLPAMEAALTRAIELDDRLLRAYEFRSYCYFRRGRIKEGLADSKKAEALYCVNPHDWGLWNVLKNRAKVYSRMGMVNEARADREKQLLFEILDQAGKAREIGQLPEAIKRIDEGLKVDPLHADLWFLRGVVNANMMKFWEAVADYNKALRYSPSSTMIYYFRGDCYEQLGKHQQAVDDYTRVIKAGDELVAFRFVCETGRMRDEILRDDTVCVSLSDVYFLRAQAYAAMGKLTAAVKDLDYVAAHDRTDDKALARRAEIIESMGKSDDSIKDFSRAIKANAKNIQGYVSRAEAYLRLGKDDEAIADFTQIIKMNPDDPGSYVLRAGAYKAVGRYDEAIADYSKAISQQMEDDLLLERADCYRAVHKYDEALKDLERAVELDASNRLLVSALRAKIFQEKGEDQNARVELLELEKKHQTDLHKSDWLYIAVGGGLFFFVIGLGWLGFKALKKRRLM
ncbi:MAG TPA: tetratricopeptide repeat protein [Candidatus Melainabacteria bacterium]|nr:tetratricopeptide repeat protein [Candidatus Melainabacteria bacterium]HIN66398.1 tetratricopeptide repeat protein [Candidatus Obscuribacterales bacterium]